MRRIAILALAGTLAASGTILGAPCVEKVAKHERHTRRSQKRAVFLKSGIPYDRAHRRLYVVDHLIPLELGGADTVSNMQLETKEEGHRKDLVENALARCVCLGKTPLGVAQKLVLHWQSLTVGTCPKEAP